MNFFRSRSLLVDLSFCSDVRRHFRLMGKVELIALRFHKDLLDNTRGEAEKNKSFFDKY